MLWLMLIAFALDIAFTFVCIVNVAIYRDFKYIAPLILGLIACVYTAIAL